MTVELVLRGLGGVAPTQVLLDRGIGKWELARAVDEGIIERIRRGVLAVPGAEADFVAAVNERARLTCISAARHYRLWNLADPGEIHLSRTRTVGLSCINHRSRSVPVHSRLPLVGLVDVLVHVLQCMPENISVPMVESALRRGETVASFIEARLPGRRNGRARAALSRARGDADSAIEVVARLIFEDAGLSVHSQAAIAGVGRVDFLVEDFLVVEIDGAAFHSDRKALRTDRRRNNVTVRGGYTVLRFCYEDVMYEPEKMLLMVLEVLGRRPIR